MGAPAACYQCPRSGFVDKVGINERPIPCGEVVLILEWQPSERDTFLVAKAPLASAWLCGQVPPFPPLSDTHSLSVLRWLLWCLRATESSGVLGPPGVSSPHANV